MSNQIYKKTSKYKNHKLFQLIQEPDGYKYISKSYVEIFGVFSPNIHHIYTYTFRNDDPGGSILGLRFSPLSQTWILDIRRWSSYIDHRDTSPWWLMVEREQYLFQDHNDYEYLEIIMSLSNRFRSEKYKCALVRPGNCKKYEEPIELTDGRILRNTQVDTSYELVHDPEQVSYKDHMDNRRFIDLIEEL